MKRAGSNEKILLYLVLISCILIFLSNVYAVIVDYENLSNGLQVKIRYLETPKINIESIQGSPFTRLGVNNCGVTGEEGTPELPIWRRLIEVPLNVENPRLEITRINLSENIKIEYPIYPVQPPWEKIRGKNRPSLKFNSSAYSKGIIYGEIPVDLSYFGVVRGKKFYLISFYPVKYIPFESTIKLYKEVDVAISWEINQKSKFMRDKRLASKYVDSLWEPFIINKATSPEKIKAPELSIPTGLLVITSINPTSKFQQWLEWKTQRGFKVTVKTVSEIGSTNTAIKQFISDAYYNWEIPPSFVVLIGDLNTLPGFKGLAYNNPITDLYYTTVDGTEYYTPDLWLGRLSVTNTTELNNIVDKILKYEKVGWQYPSDWYLKASFLAGVDNYTITEGTHNYVIDNYFTPGGFITEKLFVTSYGATTQDVISAITQGRGWLVFSGHGSDTSWSDGPELSQEQLRAINNSLYPWVLSFACDTGKYGRPECFGETWIRISSGGVGFFGSSETSYWDEDDKLEKFIMEGFFTGNTWTAGMILFGKLKYFNYYGDTDKTRRYFEMYNLFGDPSTDVWRGELQSPNCTIPTSINANGMPVPLYIEWERAVASISKGTKLFGAILTRSGSNLIPVDMLEPVQTVTLSITGNPVIPYQVELPVLSGEDAFIMWDKSIYNGTSLAVLTLVDSDLAGRANFNIQVSSSTNDFEYIQLGETSLPGMFVGSIQLTTEETPSQDDLLTVLHEGWIKAEYYDEITSSGFPQWKVAQSLIDTQPPAISQLTIDVGLRNAEFTIETNENSSLILDYDDSCVVPMRYQERSSLLKTSHKINLIGLNPNTQYFFRLTIKDEAENQLVTECSSFQTLYLPDYFTYVYESDVVDFVPLSNHRIIFTPSASIDFYTACIEQTTSFPRDTQNATVLSLSDDSFVKVELPLGINIKLYGTAYNQCFIGSNGYITFNSGDDSYTSRLDKHFSQPRVSLLFDDLNPSKSGTVSYKLEQDAMIVTFDNVARYGAGYVNVQAELFFDGRIAITWLDCQTSKFISGLSQGNGVPLDFENSEFLNYPVCGYSEGMIEVEGEGVIEGGYEGDGIMEGEGSTEGEIQIYHSADTNRDGKINLSELLRVVQFFNLGGYHCQEGTEDGYAPGYEGLRNCPYHSSDYNPADWIISLSELLRIIQIFNMGGYYLCIGASEDNFCTI